MPRLRAGASVCVRPAACVCCYLQPRAEGRREVLPQQGPKGGAGVPARAAPPSTDLTQAHETM